MEYYTYAYLREDGTPYYIGKGRGNRAYRKRSKGVKPPRNKTRIIYLKQNLTEEEAFKHEIYMISVFGRKDIGTGILINRTDGGDGKRGYKMSESAKKRLSEMKKGIKLPKKHKENISRSVKERWENPEYREKMSSLQKGKKKSEEHKRKIGEANRGHIGWNKGGTISEHQKEINRQMMKKRYENGYSVSGANNPRAKTWKITYQDGRVEIVKALQPWRIERGYSKAGLRNLQLGEWKKYRDLISIEIVGPVKCPSNVSNEL